MINKNKCIFKLKLCIGAAVALLATVGFAQAATGQQAAAQADEAKPVPGSVEMLHPQVKDKWVSKWLSVTPNRLARPLTAGKDYGMNPNTGKFAFPKRTLSTDYHGPQRFPGELPEWDKTSFSKNMNVIAFYPHVTSPWWSWDNIADFDGHRYLYMHDRDYLTIMDITDPADADVVYRGGEQWKSDGPYGEKYDAWHPGTYFGGVTMAWNDKLHEMILVASYEDGRQGTIENKVVKPKQVADMRHYQSLKGFKVYVMHGPLPKDWELISSRTTDRKNPNASVGNQQGCGVADMGQYSGGKYMIVAAAPSDSYSLQEYPTYLCSNGYQIWNMSDPSDPTFVSQITVPGQDASDPDSITAYLQNPRAGNRSSWMGARMPLFLPKSLEKGGQIGFGAMGGLGVYSFDLSDPAHPGILGHVNTPPSVSGVEFDNADVSQYARTGYILAGGYSHALNCYGAYQDIYAINAKDPGNLKVEARLPRPTPPKAAPYTSFCQRGGTFGPKRSNVIGQPGKWEQGIVPYAFYNAGVQLYNLKDPANPKISGYFIPPMTQKGQIPDYAIDNQGIWTIYTEYDRNIIWAFTTDGVYALSSPLLGKPVIGKPDQSYPSRK